MKWRQQQHSFLRVGCSLFIILGLVVGCEQWSKETIDNHFASLTETEAKDTMNRGWIPSWLPQTATDIFETHNIDSNAIMLRFSFPAHNDLVLPPTCKKTSVNALPLPPFKRTWWPDDLTTSSTYLFFECVADGYWYLAVDQRSNKAYVLSH